MKNYFIVSLLALMVACDPSDSVNPGGDDDTPGMGDPDAMPPDPNTVDNDGDGSTEEQGDCDDTDATINMGAEEVKQNGKDDDCDGQLDEVVACASGGDFSDLQAAIDAATPGSNVNVCAGSYGRLNITKPVVVAALDGAVVITGGGTLVTINGTGEGLVSLTGLTLNGASQGLQCADSAILLDKLVVSNNNNGTNTAGGIYLSNCTGTISASVIKNNQAGRGGGIFVQEGLVTIKDSEISGNSAIVPIEDYGIGGGVYLFSHSSLINNTITNNTSSARGAGICVEDHNPLIDGNTVTGNISGDDGAGIYAIMNNDLEDQTITITNNTFENNKSDGDAGGIRLLGAKATITGNQMINNVAGGDGGGMKVSHDKSIISNNVITGNKAGYGGGGIEVDDDYSTISNCIIMNNHAYHGGGVNYHENLTAFKMENTLIANNTASDEGAGINLDEAHEAVGSEFNFVTVVGNSSPQASGASFEAGQAIKVTNSIFAFNEGTQVRFESDIKIWREGQEMLITGYPAGWAFNNIFGTVEGMSYSGLSADPKFVSDTDFHLQDSSPSKGTAEGGADMGAYGGPNAL